LSETFSKLQHCWESIQTFSVGFLEQAAWKLLETPSKGPEKGKKIPKSEKS
jgi:hypothetical protein